MFDKIVGVQVEDYDNDNALITITAYANAMNSNIVLAFMVEGVDAEKIMHMEFGEVFAQHNVQTKFVTSWKPREHKDAKRKFSKSNTK